MKILYVFILGFVFAFQNIQAQTQKEHTKKKKKDEIGFVASSFVQLRTYNEIFDNESMYMNKKFTFKARIENIGDPEEKGGQNQRNIVMSVCGLEPDGLIWAFTEENISWNDLIPGIQKGDYIIFKGKFWGVLRRAIKYSGMKDGVHPELFRVTSARRAYE